MSLPGRLTLAALSIALLASAYAAQTRRASSPPRRSRPATSPAASPTPQLVRDPRWLIESVAPAEAARGERVTLAGNFPPDASRLEVTLNRADIPPRPASAAAPTPTPTATPTPTPAPAFLPRTSTKTTAWAVDAKVAADGKSLTFAVPPDARLGAYHIVVNLAKANVTYAPLTFYGGTGGAFKVVTRQPVKLTAIHPEVNYTEEKKTFSFTILGEGFSPYPEDNTLVLEGRPGFEMCADEAPPEGGAERRSCATINVQTPGELEVRDIPFEKFGPLKVWVRVGDKLSDKGLSVTLSWVKKRTPLTIAAAFLGVLALILYFVLSGRRWGRIRRRRYSLLEAVFLDRETNTYSLSKLQFYAWTLAGIFGYVYLTTAYSLIQRNLVFPDIPDNLASLLLVSVSTSTLAIGIANRKGPKGAGEEHPSLADFITTGGVVAAERLQFLVWTIVGVLGFIFLVLTIDPGKIQGLPKIPNSFLYLMGVSSFGYLGGKLARKPGPVITQVAARTGSLTLEIHGRALSPDATFRIDDVDVLFSQLDRAAHENGRPLVDVPDEQNPEYAKVLRLTLREFRPEWLKGERKLLLVNPDGQRAEWVFQVSPAGRPASPGGTQPTITAINPDFGAPAGGETVTITGTNFAPGAQVAFGGTLSPEVLFDGPTSVRAVTPQSAQVGPADVVVKNTDGTTAAMPQGFTYTSGGG